MDKQAESDRPQPAGGHNVKIIVVLIVLVLIGITLRRCRSVREVAPEILDPEAALLIVPPVLPAEPIRLPVIALPDERVELLGMLRLRDASTFPDRLNAIARRIDPEADTKTWLTDLSDNIGIDASRLRPGEHAALYIHKPEHAWQRPWLSGVLPMTGYERPEHSPLPSHFASFDRYTLFASQASDLDAVLADRRVYDEIAQQPIDGGLSLTVNLRDLWDHYGPSATLWMPIGRGMAGVWMLNHSPFSEHPESVETLSELIGTVGDMLVDALASARAITLDINLTDQYAHIDLTFAARPDTVMASHVSTGPVQAPDLMSLLPTCNHTLMITQETITDWTLLQEIYRRLMGPMISPPMPSWEHTEEPDAPPPVDETIESLITRMTECGKTTLATRMTVVPDADPANVLATDYLILTDNPEAFIALFVDHLQQTVESGINVKINSILGLTTSVHVDEIDMAPFHGPVHRVRLDTVPEPDQPGIVPAAMLDDLTTTVTYEIGRLGPYVLATSQTAIRDLADTVLNAAPTGRHPLFRAFEPGTVGVGRFHTASLPVLLSEILPAPARALLDDISIADDSLPPIDYAVYHQAGHSVSRIRIPLSLLTSLHALGENTEETIHDIDFDIPVD